MNFCCIQLFWSLTQFTWNLWRLQFGYSFLIFSFFFRFTRTKKNEWRTKEKKRTKLMFDVLGCAQYMYRQNSIIRHPSCWVRWILLTLQYDVEIPSKFDYYILKRFTLYSMCRNERWKRRKKKDKRTKARNWEKNSSQRRNSTIWQFSSNIHKLCTKKKLRECIAVIQW